VLIAASLARELGATAYFDGPTGLAGNTARLTFGSLPALQNGILGGWAVTSTGDFATYVDGLGVRGLAASGYATTLSNASTSAQNIKLGVSASSLTGNVTINSLATSAVAAGSVSIANGSILKIGSGGILSNATADWSIGTLAGAGTLTSGVSELFLYSGVAGSLVVRSVIADDGSNPVGLVKFGAGTVNLSGINTYTGGTTINEGALTVAVGSLIPKATADLSKGLVLNNAAFTQSFAGAVHEDNIVTLNGGASITYSGDNIQAGLVFNNLGGASAPTVRTFDPADTTGMAGKLTIGLAGIVATSNNVGATSVIEGRVDFGATMKTVRVDAIDINGSTDVSPLQASLALQAVVGTTGGIRKTGDGVLQFNAQTGFSGQVIVEAGGIKTGYTNAGSRFANLQLDAGTRFDLNGFSTTWGSLSGDGDVFSSSGTPTLTVGFAGTSATTTTFSGRLIRFNDAAYGQLTKVGAGTLRMDTAQDQYGSFGAISVGGGVLEYADAGRAFVSTASESSVFNIRTDGTLALNNSGSNVANRLGAAINGTVNLLGGTLALGGNAAAGSSETIANLNLTTGGSRVELTRSGTRQLNLTITNLNAPGTGSLVITGLAGSAQLNVTNANLVAGQGSSSYQLAVRGDILVSSEISGAFAQGDGFLVQDGSGWRSLNRGLYGDFNQFSSTWSSQDNAYLSGHITLTESTAVNTLTTDTFGGAFFKSISSAVQGGFGDYGTDGQRMTMTLANASAMLVKGGIVSVATDVRGSSTQAPHFHVINGATLDLNGRLGLGSSVGFVKAGDGTMNLNARTGFTGVVTVNGGNLNLFGGEDNTFVVGESSAPPASATCSSTVSSPSSTSTTVRRPSAL
jgi:autotransporter-associated beta strand protein